MEEILYNAGIGLLSGLFIAGAGYFKVKADRKTGFDKAKFVKTIILGGGVGCLAASTGLQQDLIIALPAYGGIAAFLEDVLKGLFRRKYCS